MEYQEKTVIKISELPPRAEELAFNEIQDIFGGCLADGAKCQKGTGECCNTCLTWLFDGEGTCGVYDPGP